MSGDVSQIQHDYEQVGADVNARDKLYQQYNIDWGQFMQMFAEMKAGKMNPDMLINYFFYILMPKILGKTEDTLTIVGDQLNVLSDYRSLIAQAQSDFDKFSSGNDTGSQGTQDYNDLIQSLENIQNALKMDTGNDTVLDSSTSSQIDAAVSALIGDPSKGTTGALNDYSQFGFSDGADFLNALWTQSKDPNDGTSTNSDLLALGGSQSIPGAAEIIKTITEQFNTVNTGSSTFSQAKQTDVQYQSSAYQQQLGLDNNVLQNRAKFDSSIVQNEKTS
ncbi:hypothetical protein [Simkania negevensis]|uniref:Uncharacterized protein n=1 Tax=Simkania negevensis (strain ATCC VR-1471 / DSM 27360 / Z) TaxID=331113 RepID=F8L3I6_SIMNZ|nr:hypothetical protein [Simkania negevensis]CCB89845.1 unknown protein [Simkania negevensis Z]